MSKKNSIKRLYKYSDADLKQVADKILMFVQRDAADFAAYGIAPFDLVAYMSHLDLFANFESDERLEGEKIIATQQKDSCRENLETVMRYFFTIAKFDFSTQPVVLAAFGNSALKRQKPEALIRTARSIATAALHYLPQLAAAGVSYQQIQVLQAATDAFNEAVGQQILAISSRTVVTETRIEVANKLYALIIKFASYGKLIWSETNQAKYNDYLLYDKK